jgi:hypothetical protein
VRRSPIEGLGRHIHLARAARFAGEAFAFSDAEPGALPARRIPFGGLASIGIAAAAAAALYMGF